MLATHHSPRALVKDMLQSSSLYSIATLGQRLSSFVLVPILTRHLKPADYGVLDLLEQVGIVSATLLGVNFAEALGYFYFHSDNQTPGSDGHGRTVTTTLIGATLIGLFASAIGWSLAVPLTRLVFGSEQYILYTRIVFASIVLTFLSEATLGWLRIENRTRTFVVTTLSRTLLSILGVVILVVGLGWRIGGVLGANIGAIVLVIIPLAVYCFRIYRPQFDFALFRRMVRYAVPIGFTGFGLFVIHFGDRFILPHYRSFNELGIYAIAYKVGMLLSLVHSAFHTYWSAQVFQIIRRADIDTVLPRVFTYMATVLSFCAVALIVASAPVLHIMTGPAYYGAIVLVPVIVFAYLLRAIGDFFRVVFLAQGRPVNDTAVQWIGAAICIVAYFSLIPRFGAMGAAVATLITFLTVGVIAIIWVHRLHPYRLEGMRLFKLAAVTAITVTAHFLLPVASVAGEIATGSLLLAAFLILLLIFRFPLKSEWDSAVSALRMLWIPNAASNS